MRTIYKYPIEVTDSQFVSLPDGGTPLSFGFQGATPYGEPTLFMWAEIPNTDIQLSDLIEINVFGTGNPMPPSYTEDTIQQYLTQEDLCGTSTLTTNVNLKTSKDYMLAFALDEIPTKLTNEQKIIFDVIKWTANDTNSSMYRENITNIVSGRIPSPSKKGYDVDGASIEVKPQNYSGNGKLNGCGKFSDLTWKRHNKYIKDNVILSMSGFCHGTLLYILEFSYNHPSFIAVMERYLKNQLPNGDEVNKYVRCAQFTHTSYSDADLMFKYISPKIDEYAYVISRDMYKLVKENIVNIHTK